MRLGGLGVSGGRGGVSFAGEGRAGSGSHTDPADVCRLYGGIHMQENPSAVLSDRGRAGHGCRQSSGRLPGRGVAGAKGEYPGAFPAGGAASGSLDLDSPQGREKGAGGDK